MPRPTVAVAMSGGIDSSAAAALLKEQGYTVVGMTMVAVPGDRQAVADAQRVARALRIDHVSVDCAGIFQEQVIDNFCSQYLCGRTPNPCIRCNDAVKFGMLREQALRRGADFFATGHYARIERSGDQGLYRLLPGVDKRKDQSYFLYRLDQRRLATILMPLGGMTKEQTRAVVQSKALPVHCDHESQDVCFLANTDYARFVRQRFPQCAAPGPILDRAGRVIGSHQGLIDFTVGQRRGIGIAGPGPLYVLALDPERNAVVAGEKSLLYRDCLRAAEAHWIAGSPPSAPVRVLAKIRYRHRPAAAEVTPRDSGDVRVFFDRPQMSITPGQSVVLYDAQDGFVLGGGIIEESCQSAQQAPAGL